MITYEIYGPSAPADIDNDECPECESLDTVSDRTHFHCCECEYHEEYFEEPYEPMY